VTPPPDGPGAPVYAEAPPDEAETAAKKAADEARVQDLRDWLDLIWKHAVNVNYYKLLGVPGDAPRDRITANHRALLVKYHPDRFERFDLGADRARLAAVWEHINKGIATLTNEERRREYDIFLDRKAKGLPTDPEVVIRAEQLFRQGEKLLQGGRLVEAKKLYEEAISLNRAEPEFHVALAWTEVQIGRQGTGAGADLREQARATIERSLKTQPNMDRAYLYLGYLSKMERDTRGAVAQFRKAIEVNPYNVEAKREIRLAQMRGDRDDPPKSSGGGGLFGRFRKK